MSGYNFDIHVDTQGTLERLRRQLSAMPQGITRAQTRALKKLSTWLQRQVLKEASAATGASQKTLKALIRYRVTQRETSLSIWLGTNPLKVHHLGTVRWTRRMQGARVGRNSHPGTWSWSTGRTAGVVMQRTGAYGRKNKRTGREDLRLEKIDVVTVPVHDAVITRLQAIQPAVNDRYQTLLAQELNYVLNVESRRAA